MRYMKIVATAEGGSTMQTELTEFAPIEYMPSRPQIDLSSAFASQSASFARAPAGWVGDWHPVPRHQLVVGVSGSMEFQTTDGKVCNIGAGDVILFKDLTGKGHFSQVTGTDDWVSVVIALE